VLGSFNAIARLPVSQMNAAQIICNDVREDPRVTDLRRRTPG
jgi:hypothetical protein